MSNPQEIERKVALSLALHRYLRAVDRFEAATSEFNDACKAMRSLLTHPERFIAQASFQNYLVTSDSEGNFEVETIDSL